MPVLERLPQSLERVAAKLVELVEKEHAMVPESLAMYLEALFSRSRRGEDAGGGTGA
jgi:hypothetical protein